MTKRQRERYTERTRPHRKQSGPAAAGGSKGDGFDNPIVLVAVGGLLLAIVLAIGVFFGRSAFDGSSTDQPAAADTTEVDAGDDTGHEADSGADEGDADEAEAETDASGEAGDETGDDAAAKSDEVPDGTLFLPAEGAPFAQPDDMGLSAAEMAYFSTISTDKGDIVVELWPEVAPAHANAFAFLASEGFYDGLVFHRVEDWVVQGGDPTGTGGGGPGYSIPAEFNADDPAPHRYGTLAMARSGDPNSGGSQFYFIKSPDGASYLDGQYTVFGHVVSGMDIVEQLAIGDVMTKVTFEDADISERKISPAEIRAGELPETPGGGSAE